MRTSIDIIKELAIKYNIENFNIVKFQDVPILQDRFEANERLNTIFDRALSIREQYKLPFWDAVLLTQFQPTNFSKEILFQAKYHNSIKEKLVMSLSELAQLESYSNKVRNYYLGINSKILLKDTSLLHLPLLDFHIPKQNNNLECVIEVIKNIGLPGYILETNKSYHFYGKVLLSESELISFLSRALLYSPIIDKNWIAHQLLERSCTLRITHKEGNFPFLIREV